MAQQNLVKLASQGRAYDSTRSWTEEELTALIQIETELGVSRTVAADYIRNGLRTVEECKKAKEVGFAPMSLEDLQAKAVRDHAASVRAELGLGDEPLVEVVAETVTEEIKEEAPVVVQKAKSGRKAANQE